MTNNITEQINHTIEDIWILYEQKEKEYANFNLNNQQYVILTLIMRNTKITPSALAKKISVTKSAVSQQLAKLEEENYIIRKRHKEDKRTFTIELAEKGRLFEKQMESFNIQLSQKYHEHLSSDELHNMLTSLQKLKKIVEQM